MSQIKNLLSAFLALSLLIQGGSFANPDSLAQQTAKDFTAVAKNAIPAVVSIKVKGAKKTSSASSDDNDMFNDDFFHRFFSIPRGSKKSEDRITEGQASGFIVTADGYLITNNHVVEHADEILVTTNDGQEYTGKVIGHDPNTDIAVVKIDAKNLPFLKLGDSDKLEIGEWAIAIGTPMGLQATLTVGVVSAKGRNNLDLTNVEDFIQTDAAINRGNSGGPLLNLESQVIGMNTAIVADMGIGSMGIGFAIPSNMIKQVMDQILKNGSVTRGFIGVTLQTLDKDLSHAFNVEPHSGALVAAVSKDSPAEKAGLKQGDIIRAYNDHKVTNIAALRNTIALMPPGTRLNLSVLRNGKLMDIPVEISTFPTSKPKTVSASGSKLGFDIQELTPELAHSLNITDDKGVVITKVDQNTPASWVGLKKGTLIVAVNQQKIESIDDFNKAMDSLDADKPLLLLVKQGDLMRFISLKVANK